MEYNFFSLKIILVVFIYIAERIIVGKYIIKCTNIYGINQFLKGDKSMNDKSWKYRQILTITIIIS